MLTTVETDVLTRMFDSNGDELPPQLARYLLSLKFSEADQERFERLSLKNQDGTLSEQERAELDGMSAANDVLMLLQSRARRALRIAGEGLTNGD